MSLRISVRAALAVLGMLALVSVRVAPLAAQETGTVQGTVVDAATNQPLAGVQVFVVGPRRGALTNAQGRFQIVAVPAGQHTVQAQLLGYTTASATVNVVADQAVTVNLSMTQTAIALQEVVVTGTVGATERAKVPFAVSKLSDADLVVPTVTAGTAIQGRVAGATVTAGSGRPGAAPSILLRGPTSINASGRDQEPLYIVDGVILAASMVDFDALDIESIEVVKGAAGASLYGSRAQSGVIHITTRRGGRAAQDQVRYTLRSELGQSVLGNTPDALFTTAHQYEVRDGQFVTTGGALCHILECPGAPRLAGQRRERDAQGNPIGTPNVWNSFVLEPYPGPTYDHVGRFFREGNFLQNYISAEGRTGGTNFHISFSNLQDQGIMRGQDGFFRNNFRVNLDQTVRPDIQVSASAFYSRSDQHQFPELQGNPIFALTRVPAGVNLYACEHDRTQECLDRPRDLLLMTDPFYRETANPLYNLMNREYTADRGRFLASGNVRYSPLDWINVDANVSYDRLDYEETDYYIKGFRTISPSAALNQGYLGRHVEMLEALNGSATATFIRSFGNVNNRTQLRYLFESQERQWTTTEGSGFTVGDVPHFGNVDQTRLGATSATQPVRADGYFAITNFDIADRYIIDALVRNDGSSLFGAEERRHWYGRIAGAWRLGAEPWFAVPAIDEFKLRYSYGTAGGRPNFVAQYETFSVAGGVILPVNLGNRELKPEFTREHEAGLDAGFLNNRLLFTLTYADSETRDQILLVPLPGYMGFGNQWQNAGTLASNTWEVSLDARLLQTRDLNWSARILFDRTRQQITELQVPAYTYGVEGQAMGDIFYARPGEPLGTFYGLQVATNCNHLPANLRNMCDQFAVNNDGFLVWVGPGGSLNNPQWGTQAPAGVAVQGIRPMWGEPIVGECEDRLSGEPTTFCPLGKGLPDFKLSFSSNLSWRGLTLYGLLDSWQGFNIYNQPLQWTIFRELGGIMDQRGVPEELQKPVGYYNRLYGVSGLRPSSPFVEDGSFIKLRELSLGYRLGADLLGGVPGLSNFNAITLSLIGRNLMTWTNYRGFDPEVGRGGGTTGSASLARVEGFGYPPFRTWTLGVELNF